MSSSEARKRKSSTNSIKSSKVSLLTPSLLLLEIPVDTNTTLPVWDAVRSQQVDIAWTVTPYSINVRFTPLPSKPEDNPSPSQSSIASSPAQLQSQPPVLSQPQIIIQPLPQQAGSESNPVQNHRVVLTFPQSSPQPCPTNNISLRPVKCTSLILPLPLIIAQPQPAQQSGRTTAPHQSQVSPPSPPLLPLQPPSCSPFHTVASRSSLICDLFLAGVCQAGSRCELHHTPFPYHWQRWSVTSTKWVDLPPRAQLRIERLYCDVDTDKVTLQEGSHVLDLDFEAMKLENIYTHDMVRRLCNTTHPAVNFPTKWCIFWLDDWNRWKEYNEDVSSLLLLKMSDEETDCQIHIGGRHYEVDLVTMIQTNITTGYQRKIRKRPAYRSPVQMHPRLRTGILTGIFPTPTAAPMTHFNEDPLVEFCTWYPPVWGPNQEQNNSMVEVPVLSQAYQKIHSLFHQSMPETKVEILSIWQIQNVLHWDKFQRYKEHMKRDSKPGETLEKHLFHGTRAYNIRDICHNNFDHRISGDNCIYGRGTYFARDASCSNKYAKCDDKWVQHMFLAKVLVGKMCRGKSKYRRPPSISKEDCNLYDTCVDKLPDPSVFVVFDRCQCYPYYLIKYRDLPTLVDIAK